MSCFALHPTNPAIFFSGSKVRHVLIGLAGLLQCFAIIYVKGMFFVNAYHYFSICANYHNFVECHTDWSHRLQDKTVRIWDRRLPQCVGQCGIQDPNTFEVGNLEIKQQLFSNRLVITPFGYD